MSNILSKSYLSIEDAALDWKDAVESGRSGQVMQLYSVEAIFFGALSYKMCTSGNEIKSYYEELLKLKELRVNFLETSIRLSGNTAVNSGIYRYDYLENNDRRSIVVRYTFVLIQQMDKWLIMAHHSSVLPQNILGK